LRAPTLPLLRGVRRTPRTLLLPLLLAALAGSLGLAGPPAAAAGPEAPADATSAAPAAGATAPGASAPGRGEDALPEARALTGREIYQCVLDNRFDAYVQTASLASGDRGGSVQESALRMTWRSFRDEEGEPGGAGVLSKTMVKYTEPFDLRFSGYLIVNNHARSNDQFVYLAASRRIRRVNLRREAVFGTDFTFEDIVPREIEDGTYERLPDKILEGTPVYVVEVTPKEHAESEYSRFVLHVEREHCVPILTRYWDDKGVEVKELTAPPEHVEEHEGVWVPMELVMRNLQMDTYTRLRVEKLVPNPDLARTDFDIRRLESH